MRGVKMVTHTSITQITSPKQRFDLLTLLLFFLSTFRRGSAELVLEVRDKDRKRGKHEVDQLYFFYFMLLKGAGMPQEEVLQQDRPIWIGWRSILFLI